MPSNERMTSPYLRMSGALAVRASALRLTEKYNFINVQLMAEIRGRVQHQMDYVGHERRTPWLAKR
jgi:hypothetical protein